MKKFIALFVSAALVMSLAACGGSTPAPAPAPAQEPAQSAPAASEPAAEPAAPSGGSTLTVWCWDPAFNLYAMEEAAKVYKETNPEFVLNIVETPWDDLQTKLITAASSGDLSTLPDIFLCQDNAFQKNVINYPDVFYALNGGPVDFSQFPAAKTAYSVVDGKNYGVPFDNGTCINALRTDVLAEAGYTIADFTDITWDDYIAKGKDVLAKTGKPLVSSAATSPDMIMMMLQSTGASLFNPDGTPNIVNNEALKQVLNTYTEAVKSGVLFEVNNWDEYIASFVNETVCGTINGCWILGSIQSAPDQSGKWAITNLPKLNTSGATNYSNNGGSSWAVSSNTKNPELAMDFLAKTFGGSVKFYETILPSAGALATYLPAGSSSVYSEPQEFFGGAPIYADITAYAGKTPSNITGAYYYEARDAVAVAMTNIVKGANVDSELKAAEETVLFQMGQ